jgi:hypothetical protein
LIAYPPSLKAIGGAHTGIAPVNLLDVQDANGNLYYWSDRPIVAPTVINASGDLPARLTPPVEIPTGDGVIWSYATSVVSSAGNTGGSAKGDTSSGHLICEARGPFTVGPSLTWSGFKVPDLPSGTVIHAAYIVALPSIFHGDMELIGPCNSGSGQVYVGEGATVEEIESAAITYTLQLNTLPSGGIGFEALDHADAYILEVALAIYCTFPESAAYIYSPGSNGVLTAPYVPWLVEVPEFKFYRSLQTDVGAFVLQNLSGDTLSRDFEKLMRRSTLEGALFVYRLWQADAQAAWLEVHGTLSVSDVGVDTVTLKGAQLLNPGQDDTPLEVYGETCQLQWGGKRCGATGSTECNYSFQSCQVIERIMVAPNHYEKNYGETVANTAANQTNRRRLI